MARPKTVYLGQFVDESVERLAPAFDRAGIVWWHKTHGRFTRLMSAADWGVRVFVEESRLEDARRIAKEIVGEY